MPPFKPMKLQDYLRWIRRYGWQLQKAGTDWILLDEKGKAQVINIILTHPGKEIIPIFC